MAKNSREPPKIGDRLIVDGIMYAQAYVKKRLRNEKTEQVVLVLYWTDDSGKDLGESHVNLDDEDKIWYRYSTTN